MNHLKPENIVKIGNGQFTEVPKVINAALDTIPCFKFYRMTGLEAQINLCETCAETLDWQCTKKNGDIEHNWNGHFRVQYGEDQYLEGHYFRCYPEDKPIAIDQCDCCKESSTMGFKYRLDVDEIDYGQQSVREFALGDRVSVLQLDGEIAGWTDSRLGKRQYRIRFDNGLKGSFLNWQMHKIP